MALTKLNDIRVGDWFTHLHGRGVLKAYTVEMYCKCVVLGGDIVEVDHREMMPIGLSKAVLEHSGFKEQCSCYYYLDGRFVYNPMAKQVAYIDENGYHAVPWRVEHLHQLQHIFYELTGKELECDMFGLANKIMEGMNHGNTSEI